MPDPQPLEELHSAAVASIGAAMTSRFGAVPLSESELVAYRAHAIRTGWRFSVAYGDGERRLDLLIPKTVPFGLPKVALVDRPEDLTWPHIESDGTLCVADSAVTIDVRDPVGVAVEILREADKLIQANLAGNRQDFLDEFHSYWHRAGGAHGKRFLSLIDVGPPSRTIRAWRGREFVLLADHDARILGWLQKRYGKPKNPWTTTPAVFVWLEEPLVPEQYPKLSGDVIRLLANIEQNSVATLETLAQTVPDKITLLLGALSKNGPCLAGITLDRPATIKLSGAARHPYLPGFRPCHTPAPLLAASYLNSTTPITKSNVSRVDASWIHGRGHDPRQRLLADAIIILAGCGSVGGHVGVLLAEAGVGRLIFVDPQNLEWANTGRHPLGAKSVDSPKAGSLEAELRQMYPHLEITAHNVAWEELAKSNPSVLQSASIIINATGSWMSNAAMNAWQRTLKGPTVLYGWTEAYACAGHAVAIGADGACLECGFDHLGHPKMPITAWISGATERREPACGAIFQPYGPIELMNIVQLIASAALDILTKRRGVGTHWAYASHDSFLKDCGGKWNPEWASVSGWKPEGGCTIVRQWLRRPDCLGSH